MIAAAAGRLAVCLEAVDSNGVIPLADHGRAFTAARFYRAFMQRVLREHVVQVPEEAPLTRLKKGPQLSSLPRSVTRRWPAASARLLTAGVKALSALPIDHTIPPVAARGGHDAAARTLRRFVTAKLSGYDAHRNHPDDEATSRLSPYLHFGHVSAHEVFSAVMTHERWTTRRLGTKGAGRREGWWGVSAAAEAFLDQLVVWRELAFNGCEYVTDYASYDSLPEWARSTLAAHRDDPRPHTYTLERLEAARTDDPLWNAVQRQLVAEGWFHGYLRMLWGKKILEWSAASRRCARADAVADGSIRPRRPRSELVRRLRLGARALRPSVATAADLRHRPLHVVGEHEAEAEDEAISGAIWRRRQLMSMSLGAVCVAEATQPVLNAECWRLK